MQLDTVIAREIDCRSDLERSVIRSDAGLYELLRRVRGLRGDRDASLWIADVHAWFEENLITEILLMAEGFIVPQIRAEDSEWACVVAWAAFFDRVRPFVHAETAAALEDFAAICGFKH